MKVFLIEIIVLNFNNSDSTSIFYIHLITWVLLGQLILVCPYIIRRSYNKF